MFLAVISRFSRIFFNPTYLACLLTVCLLWACKKRSQAVSLTQAQTDSLKMVTTALKDSVQTTWQDMLASDAQKLRHVDTLLVRIKAAGPADPALLEKVNGLRKSFTQKQYTTPEGLTSAKIDDYDAATDSLVSGVKSLYSGLKQPQRCENCEELISRIEQLDEKVLPYRMRYDQQADVYNGFIRQNQELLNQSAIAYDTTHCKPLFRLEN